MPLPPKGNTLVGPSMTSTTDFMTSARDVQFNGGTYSVVGRDVHNHYHLREFQVDISAILRAIPNFRKIHQDTISKATEGTGRWLFETEEFRIWLDINGDIKILWGSGIAGAGKTIVASIVIAHLEALAETDSQVSVAYIYIRYSDRAQVTVRTVLETLVKQAVERHPEHLGLVEQLYLKHLREDTKPTEEQLLGLLRVFTDGKRTYYVLDALDEAPPELQLEILAQLSSLDARLFITSRPLKALEACVPQARHLTIAAKDHDLDLHIAKVIKRSVVLQRLLGHPDSTFRKEVVSLIKEKCGGMFLHASLQLEAIGQCGSVFGIKQRLAAFPPRIEDVYLQTWERVISQSAEQELMAKTALLWVLNAASSMTIDQLRHAVATCPETYRFEEDRLAPEEILIGFCCGLLLLEEETRLVRLVHYTAKETLTRLILEKFPRPHSILASVCITHLTGRGFQDSKVHSREHLDAVLAADPLLAYAHRGWAFHSQNSLEDKTAVAQVTAFVAGCKALPSAIPNVFDILGPLHVVALHNLPTSLVAETLNPNVTTKHRGETPLGLACSLGYKARVCELLALPNILVNHPNANGWSALMSACPTGEETIVRFLLAHPDIKVDHVGNSGWSALMLACWNGHESTAKLLLAHPDTKVDAVDNDGWSAFMLACRNGHESTVKLLLAHPDTKVNGVDNDGWSAFLHACCSGHEGTVKLLLSHPDTKVDGVDDDGWSALMLACCNGHESTVQLLLAHPGVRVDGVDNGGWSAFLHACCSGHESTVKLMLSHPDTKVDGVDNDGWSALMLACCNGHESTVQLLLAHPGTKVNGVDNDGRSALMHACCDGHESTVQLLLAHPDTKVDGVDNEGRSAFMLACLNGQESIAKLLLAHPDVKINRSDPHGTTALPLAADGGHSHVVRLLLTVPDIDVNPVDGDGDTAIKMAAEDGYEEIVRMLLEIPSIDVTIPSIHTGHTALSAALANGHSTIVQLLQDFHVWNGIPIPASLAGLTSSNSGNTVPRDNEAGDACEDVPDSGSDTDDSDAFEDALEKL